MESTTYSTLLKRCFPESHVSSKNLLNDEMPLISEQKKILAFQYLSQAEKLLLDGNLDGIAFFKAAAELESQNAEIYFRQGLAFYEYGIQRGKEKILLLASKSFKKATQLNPQYYQAYLSWGGALLELGHIHQEHHYFLQAKEVLTKALAFTSEMPKESVMELYWDLGLIWKEIAGHSGEALDVRMAIHSFRSSLSSCISPSASFWNDFGSAYLQMGLLINDNRHYLQAIQHFEKALKVDETNEEAWSQLASARSQLYINTMDEAYFRKANESFSQAIRFQSLNEEIWLDWASLLGESGKICKDPKTLRLSVEKCIRAHSLAPDDHRIVGQWVESLSQLGTLTSRYDLLVEAENKIIKMTELYPDAHDLWYSYGLCMLSLGDYYEDPGYYDFAIEKIQNGLALDRSNAELWHLLALSYKKLGTLLNDDSLLELGAKFFLRAIDLKPACPTLIFDQAENYLNLAEITSQTEHARKAFEYYEYGIQLQKNALLYHPEILFGYASALYLYGEIEEEEPYVNRAVEVFWQVLLIEPDYPQIHLKLGTSFAQLADYASDSQLFQKAFHYFRIAAKLDSENENLWLEWGLSLIHFAHLSYDTESLNYLYGDAEQKLTKAGRLGNLHAYYHLACLYSLTGKMRKAMLFLEKARVLDVLPEIQELLHDEWLEQIRETESFALFLSRLESKQSINGE